MHAYSAFNVSGLITPQVKVDSHVATSVRNHGGG